MGPTSWDSGLLTRCRGNRVGGQRIRLQHRRRKTSEGLTKGRASVEREFGRLKDRWRLAPLRVRGIERVRLHADLTILAKLSCALAGARAAPLAA